MDSSPFSTNLESGLTTRRNSTGSLSSRYVPKLLGSGKDIHHHELELLTALGRRHDESKSDLHHAEMEKLYSKDKQKLPIRQRLAHFTWAWYTLPMSTGGLSLLLRNQPFSFPQLNIIGCSIYIANIAAFLSITAIMILRFTLHPGSFRTSVTHPREGLFVPTAFLSIATLLTNTEVYVIPFTSESGKVAMQVLFWLYVSVTLILAVGQYSFLFASHTFALHTMMPTWILPIFPIMLSGTIASVISRSQSEDSALAIATAGLTCQGLGLSVAVFMYAHMIGRLMQTGLPNREHRPGLFMCVGPPAFTAIALIGMAKALPLDFDELHEGIHLNAEVLGNVAVVSAVFLWALSLWWFGIALVAVLASPPKHFHLGWWATVFPNVGFTLATISIANEFNSVPIQWFTTGMSIVMIVTYCFVLYNHVRAVIVQDIMYPGLDEDVEDA